MLHSAIGYPEMENSIRGDYRPCILQATSSMAEDYVLLYLRIPREFIRLSSPPAYVMSNQTTRRIFLTGFGSVLVAGEAVGSVSAQRGGNPNQSIRIVQPTDDILKEGETYTARAVFQGGKLPMISNWGWSTHAAETGLKRKMTVIQSPPNSRPLAPDREYQFLDFQERQE